MDTDFVRHITPNFTDEYDTMLADDFSASLSGFYDDLKSWLTTKTLGGTSHKSFFQYYDKKLWLPIRKMLENAASSKTPSISEAELLSCRYSGELFRIQRYYKRKHGQVYPLGCYQSWSREAGLQALSNIGGEILLIRAHASPLDYAISTSELLLNINPEVWSLVFCGRHELSRYKNECEVVMPISTDNIDELLVVESAHLCEWRTYGTPLPKEKWFRNNWR